MNNYWLKVSFSDLSNIVQQQITKGEELQSIEIPSEEDLGKARTVKREWINGTAQVLNNCFAEPNNVMVNEFRNSASNANGFHISGQQSTFKQEVDKFRNSIAAYIKGLHSFLDDAKMSDIMFDPNTVNIDERKNWTIEEQQIFILDKLSKGRKGAYYEIQRIMESNGLEIEDTHETMELVEDMKNLGMVERFQGLGVIAAKITVQGKKFIEQSRKKPPTDTSTIDRSSAQEYEDMSVKIDEIIEHLKKAGVEREILFEELQELKELYKTLSKKNWKHIVLGKLADLALSKVIEKETFTDIYQQLTGVIHRLS